jgi:hypothetical protein
MREQQKQQNDSNIKAERLVSTAEAKQPHKDLPNIEIVVPGCRRVDDSEAALRMIADSIELFIEAAHRGWCATEDISKLSTELAKWLVEVCDPKRECKICKIGKGLGPGIKDERTMA